MLDRASAERFHDSEHVFRMLLDSVSDHAIYMLDCGGFVTNWNVGAERAKGYTASEIVGRHFSVFYTPEDRARDLPARALETASRDGRFEAEGWRLKKDGSRFFTNAVIHPMRDETGCLIGFSKVTRDITERRKADLERRSSESRYRILANSSSDVIMQLDLQLCVCYISPACYPVLGFESDELLLQPSTDFIHFDEAENVAGLFKSLVEGGIQNDRTVTTCRIKHKNGHYVWGEVAVNLVRDLDSGLPDLIICSLRDVTERQRVSKHLNDARIAAENASRQKAEFVANMSHELRTPLTAILGLHDLLHSDPTLSDKQRRYLNMASNAGRSLLGIVNDILDLSKIEAGELAIQSVGFDLTLFTETCRQLALPQADAKSIYCRTHLTGPDVVLMGDAARLQQIVLNVLTNAVKFTEKGGVDIRVSYSTNTSKLRIEVSDTGIGIDEGKVPLLFERFTQADESITRRYGGTGLGLAICKRLTELMGGEIGLHSKIGSGTTVWLEIRLETANRVAAPTVKVTLPDAKYHVLLAEDNQLNQEIISAILEQRGHMVTRVGDGVAAMMAVQSATSFDVVLMDLQMPIMDGLSATRAIRLGEVAGQRKQTPIIGLTANAMIEDVERCSLAGMQAHVAKPIEWNDLISAIDRVAGKAAQKPERSEPGETTIGFSSVAQLSVA